MRQTNTPPSVYYKYQKVFKEVVNEMETPVIWNTQRQMGKSTVLADIASNYLRKGDVWVIGPKTSMEEMFLDKVYATLPDDVHARKTKSRIELATLNGIHFIGSPSKFHKTPEGLDLEYNQPILVIVDELAHTTLQRLDTLLQYIKDPKKVKFVATTTGTGKTDYQWVMKNFGRPEVITTAFESINIWTEDLLNGQKTKEILRT